MQTGKCQFVNLCSFAHGRHELRSAQEAARHASKQSLKQLDDLRQRQVHLDKLKAEHGSLPVPIDPNLDNVTFSSRIVRVMASPNYPGWSFPSRLGSRASSVYLLLSSPVFLHLLPHGCEFGFGAWFIFVTNR
jgi:hypothetical protein